MGLAATRRTICPPDVRCPRADARPLSFGHIELRRGAFGAAPLACVLHASRRQTLQGLIMNRSRWLGACLWISAVWMASRDASADWRMPPQIELRVPFEPTAYPSGGQSLLMYELYVTNFSGNPVDIRRIEVLDSGEPAGKPLAAFEGDQIDPLLQNAGGQSGNVSSPRTLNPGATAVVYMQVRLDAQARLPDKLRH